MSTKSERVLSTADRHALFFFFFQAEDGIRDLTVTGVQTCALPIFGPIGLRGSQKAGRQRLAQLREDGARALTIGGCTSRNEFFDVGFEHVEARLRSEEHTSELQSQANLVCRLLL